MTRTVYACRFDLQDGGGMSKVFETYGVWITSHYKKRHNLENFSFEWNNPGEFEGLPIGHALSLTTYNDNDEQAVRIQWSFPNDPDISLRWSNNIRVGQFGDRCSVEHLIAIESVEYNVSPAKLLMGSPRAIRDICTNAVALVGEMQVKAQSYVVQQAGLSTLLNLLTSEMRRLPVVLLSPYTQGEPNKLDADKLAKNLAGVAVVVRILDPDVTWDFADEIGRELSCFDGAARIYWPGFTKNSYPLNHRLLLSTWIERTGPAEAARTIEQTIFGVAAFRFVPDKRITDLIRRVESAERQKVLDEKRSAGEDFWTEYERDLARLDEAKKRIEELESENANIKANQNIIFMPEAGASDEIGSIDEEANTSFSSVTAAVLSALKSCTNLVFLDSAIAAADKSPFQRPFDIYQALVDLNKIVDVWRRNHAEKGSGGDLLLHLRHHGWGKRSSMHISNTTRGRHRAHYEFDYQGKKQLFEPHITIGSGDANSCASIHFIFDQPNLKMIIGHVGEHLPNTKT